jgi:hypothetical protein
MELPVHASMARLGAPNDPSRRVFPPAAPAVLTQRLDTCREIRCMLSAGSTALSRLCLCVTLAADLSERVEARPLRATSHPG